MSRKEGSPPLLDFLPRPGMREIRIKAAPVFPLIRNERMTPHGKK